MKIVLKNKLKNKLNRLPREDTILYIICVIYLILSLIFTLTHELWVDEAQAWEIAKRLSIPEIVYQMKYEAHSCFWHLILAIPAKLGISVTSMKLISWFFTSIAALYVILQNSKLNLLLKIIIIFNPTFIYYSSAISRNYCLVIFLLSMFSLLYDKRFEHPIIYTIIIGLLAHTHIIICGFVGIASLLFLIELIQKKDYKQFIISLLILLLFFVLLALQIFPALKNCIFVSKEKMSLAMLWTKILSSSKEMGTFFLKAKSKYLLLILLILILTISTIVTFINNKQKGIMLFISILFMYIVHIYWPFSINERTCVIFATIVLLNLDNKKIAFTVFITVLSLLIIFTNMKSISIALINGYSDSKNVGSYINKFIPSNSLIIILDIDRHTSAIPYIDNSKNLTYYNIQNEAYQSFMTWDAKAFREKEYFEIEEEIETVSNNYNNIYILYGLTSNHNKYIENTILKLYQNKKIEEYLYQTINPIYSERFSIYKYKRGIKSKYMCYTKLN